VQQALAL